MDATVRCGLDRQSRSLYPRMKLDLAGSDASQRRPHPTDVSANRPCYHRGSVVTGRHRRRARQAGQFDDFFVRIEPGPALAVDLDALDRRALRMAETEENALRRVAAWGSEERRGGEEGRTPGCADH